MAEGKKVNAQVQTDEETRDTLYSVLDGIRKGSDMTRGEALRVVVEQADARRALGEAGTLAEDVEAIQRACATITATAKAMASKHRAAADEERARWEGRTRELEARVKGLEGQLADATKARDEAQERAKAAEAEAKRQREAAEHASAMLDAALGLRGDAKPDGAEGADGTEA